MTISKFLNPKNDVAFRKIFGTEKNKDILIHFINDILGLKGADKIKSVTFLSPIQNPEIASKKESIVDVLCKAASGEQIIVEMQVSPQEGFEKRAQYYAAKAYCRQLNKGDEREGKYQNLKEIIFIAISDYIMFPSKKGVYKSDHVILDKKSLEHDLKDFYFTFIELPKFTKDKIEDLENIVEKWCYFFKYAHSTSESDVQKIKGSDLVIERAYEELNQFNWTEAELIEYEQEIKRMMDARAIEDYRENRRKESIDKMKKSVDKMKKSVDTMKKSVDKMKTKLDKTEQKANKAEAKLDQAEQKANKAEAKFEKAKQESKEAKARGIAEGIEKIAKNLLNQNHTMEFISGITGLSIPEIEKLKNEE